MEQNEIREYNNVTYSIEEGAAIIAELKARTDSDREGYNSIDELGQKLQALLIGTVIVFGNPFTLRKNPSNNNPAMIATLEKDDIILNGFKTLDVFWTAAKYLGGDVNDDANWAVIIDNDEISIL